MNVVHSFSKDVRLCSRKAIETLFAGGNRSMTAFPLRVVYTPGASTKVLISVSKRHFKRAVDRNRAKRQIREAWRLHRNILAAAAELSAAKPADNDLTTSDVDSTNPTLPPLHLAFIWLSDEPQSSSLVHRKLKLLLHRIREEIDGVKD